jgi:hypothetical protein
LTAHARRIDIHPAAPSKPAVGAACNGCGICCLVEPCPVGMLVSRRRHGACHALQWSDAQQRYLCGMVVDPAAHLPRGMRWTAVLWRRWARRLIAAGIGCDCDWTPGGP